MKLSEELLNNLIEITSNSAIACYPYIGKNEKILADKAATDVMRHQLNKLNMFNQNSVIVTVFCDHGSRYMSKIYSDEWMKNQGFSIKTKDEQESQIEFIR